MAPAWKRILKWIAWLFGGALALIIGAFVTLLAINWRDRPPSAAAERLAATYRNRAPIPDADNAYVYAMGFFVAPDGDPREAGMRRIEWLRSLPGDLETPISEDPVPAYDAYKASRSAEVEKIIEACWRIKPECAAALEGSEGTLRSWISSEQWLLDRYRTLLRHPGWLEEIAPDPRAPFAVNNPLLEGQKLWLAQAYLLASENDAAAATQLLSDDARFWRGVLASSDLLVTKMVATVALTQTFAIGNLVLRRLPAESQLSALPLEWTKPFSIAERSLFRCMSGEWLYGLQLIRQATETPTPFSHGAWGDGPTGKWLARVTELLLQPQDLSNRYAEVLIEASEAVDVPVEQLPTGLDRARTVFQNPNADRGVLAMLYNPTGSMFLEIATAGKDAFIYPARVTDLEGARRAVVLTTQLRAQKIREQNLAVELAASDIRTPYSGAPFIWNAKERAVQFIGLTPGERGRHTFRY